MYRWRSRAALRVAALISLGLGPALLPVIQANAVHLALPGTTAAALSGTQPSGVGRQARSVAFEPNVGQFNSEVLFAARDGSATFFITRTGYADVLAKPSSPGGADAGATAAVAFAFVGATSSPTVTASDALPSHINYLVGNDPARWHRNVPTYGSVTYWGVYPKIDLVFYGKAGHIEHDWIVHPGGDVSMIRLRSTLGPRAEKTGSGNLEFRTPVGTVTQAKPQAYVGTTPHPRSVAVNYVVEDGGVFGYAASRHDQTQTLVIDPLVYSTYLGGSSGTTNGTNGKAIALDSNGNTYIAGSTTNTDYPVLGPFQKSYGGGTADVVVSKLSPDGSHLVYSTYLGGRADDEPFGIAVDSSGDAFVVGSTNSSNFPTAHALQGSLASSGDAFVSELNASGSALVYSTYLGGADVPAGWGGASATAVAVDSSGNAYVTGVAGQNFPTVNPIYTASATAGTQSADEDVWAAKISTGGARLVYSTYLPGNDRDEAWGIAVDASGSAYVAGDTRSSDFPTTAGAVHASWICCNYYNENGFLSKINSTGSALAYSTFLGGTGSTCSVSGYNAASAVAVDIRGDAYVAGTACGGGVATTGAYQAITHGGEDAFVAELVPDGSAIANATYLGGSDNDEGHAVAIDSSGDAYVGGLTSSTDFPVAGAIQSTYQGNWSDGFLAELNPSMSTVAYSTYLGGQHSDNVAGVTVDSAGDAFVTGSTGGSGFPTTVGAFQSTDPCACSTAFVSEFIAEPTTWPSSSSELWGEGSPGETVGYRFDGGGVNVATGNLVEAVDDLSIPGRGRSLGLRRTYNSQDAATETALGDPLGYGWTDSYDVYLTVAPDYSTVTVHQENGSTTLFSLVNGVYTAAQRITATLVQNAGGYQYTLANQASDQFDSGGRLVSESDRNGHLTTLSYDASGHVATATDSGGRTLTFTYTTNGLMQSVADQFGRSVTYGYDANLNLAQVTDVNRGITYYTYDAAHRLIGVQDPTGATTLSSVSYTADGSNRVASEVDGSSPARTTTYAYAGNTVTVTHAAGDQTVYQQSGTLSSEITYGANTSNPSTWEFGYDPADNESREVDPLGDQTTTSYDSLGDVLSSVDALGRVTSNTYVPGTSELQTTQGPDGTTTTFQYDSSGNLTSVSRPLTGTSSVATTAFTYDQNPATKGDLLTKVDPNGKTWSYTSDQYGMPASTTDPLGDRTTFAYDGRGFLASKVGADGNVTGGNPAAYTTSFGYDAAGHLTSTVDPLGHQSTAVYDGDGRLQRQQDAVGNVTQYIYDPVGELVTTTRADNSTLRSTYDSDGRLTSQIDGAGHTTSYGYDGHGWLTSATDPLNRITQYGYDATGRLHQVIDPMARTTTIAYDAAGEKTGLSYSDGVTPNVTFTYYPTGLRHTMADGTGTTTYVYDSLFRPTQITNGAGAVVSYTYDLNGNVTRLTYPSGSAVTRAFDDASRLTGITDWSSHSSSFSYDASSNPTGISYPNGTTATFSFDADNRLMGIQDTHNNATFLSFTYGRDNANQLTSTQASGVPGSGQTYAYNSLRQLASLNGQTYTYDASDHPTTVGLTTPKTLTYDTADEVKTSAQGSTTTNFGYNADGDRTSATTGSTVTGLTFDQANRMTAYGSSTSYTYNGDGLRATKKVGHTTEAFTWDAAASSTPEVLVDGATNLIYGPQGLPIEQVTSGTTYYFHQDQNGSTRALTDSNGNVVRTASYDPYGTLSGSTGTVTTPFGFDGQYTDSESGFQYLRARYYDPSTAQFLSRDPLAGVTHSPYGYAEDSPLNATDPTGLAGCPVQALCDFFGGNGQRITDWFAAHSRDVARYTSATLNAVVAAIPIVGELRMAELGAEAGQVATEGEASALAYPGGLGANDALGGHVLSHVGLSDVDLGTRGIQNASSFLDRATAESTLADVQSANSVGIQSWLSAAGPGARQAFGATFDSPIGRLLARGAPGSVDATTAIAVLQADASSSLGYFLLTGYAAP
jgi:RHS repeat-associated protein